MAGVEFSHQLDLGAVRALLTSPQGPVVRDLLRRGLLVETQAKRNLGGIGGPKRVDSGLLRSKVAAVIVTRNGEPAVLVSANTFYARWVHDGTGVYGPRATPIRPKKGKFLRFRPRGSRKWIYARQVKGMRPNPFLANALPAARG